MTTQLDDLTWDIDTLVDNRGADGVAALLDDARERAEDLARNKGRVASFDADDLAGFMTELGEIHELIGRGASYAHLWFSTDTADPERGALLQRVQERATEISTMLLFFELEWTKLPDEAAQALLADERLDQARHHLEIMRRFRDHLLSEPEEKILSEKAITARAAWGRLFSELTSSIEVELDGEVTTVADALSRLSSHDREVRRRAGSAMTAALQEGLRTRAFIYNMLVHDKATDDRLRGYDHWLQSFNLSQEASDGAVEALVTAVRGRYDLPQRWYSLKAKLLGLDKLAYYDRAAAMTEDEALVEWDEARGIVTDCYSSFSPALGDLVRRFFDERWIDVPTRTGKVQGAFCAPTAASHHPYVLVNYTSKRRDVLTLAHELGHGVHQALGSSQGPFHHTTPLTVAETASVFGETIVFNRLLALEESPSARFALLAQKVEDSLATVFRQVAMNRFEASVHNGRRNEGELSVERLGDLWIETQSEMLGDAVELEDDYRSWWSYVPHFIHVPGYVYAYAFGFLLAVSVYRVYEEQGDSFVPRYLEMLSAGGSRSPEELARIVGCDLSDPAFWEGGLSVIERDIDRAEAAAPLPSG
ncbi:MAG: M3 family oligoendopeptidase [Actinomycetota bacterium]|nr:M3 family oligoendopeptidase [Actinomycetota bacterium]